MAIYSAKKNPFWGKLDPKVRLFDPFKHPFTQQIWRDKYRYKDEAEIDATFWRVAQAIGDNEDFRHEIFHAMVSGLWMPGGRILAGAGTDRSVTLMNCYVNRTLDDSMQSIMDASKDAAVTLQHGGGIGTDFSPLRPKGATVKGVGSKASGPMPFMDMFHSMSDTVMSAGHRRGAMMGTISDTHPDLPLFIKAKQEKGRLTNFNVSILVSDAFMEAVKEDVDWMLYFPVEPVDPRPQELIDEDFFDNSGEIGEKQYVYSVWKARELWELITKNTYEFSEPGVIFIDRVNDLNNLKYCEEIRCTNPCGEQPLPPNGTCNLGAINLARLILNPYTDKAEFNFELLREIASLGVRFLDNVIEVTNYPLNAQREEELSKRRLGLGVSGLADALAQMKIRYGSPAAVALTEKIFYHICQAAYHASASLADERKPFPLYDKKLLENDTFAATRLDHSVIARIHNYGLRNGVLLTVAPTGTTSILYGDVSSGIEPVFAHEAKRRVRDPDGQERIYDTLAYGKRFYQHCVEVRPDFELPPYMVTIDDLTVEDHITMQAAVQKWIDASVSKTVNCPKDITYESFVRVYDLAYTLGAKGCTTYRPSDVRGSILLKEEAGKAPTPEAAGLLPRVGELSGRTRKIKWPTLSASLYLTVNYQNGRPHEVFFNSKDARLYDWMVATSLMMTSLLRKGGDVRFIAEELKQVQSLHDVAFIKGPGDEHPRSYGSLIALIGAHLAELLVVPEPVWIGLDMGTKDQTVATAVKQVGDKIEMTFGEKCPGCGGMTLFRKEGCKSCINCSYSDCG